MDDCATPPEQHDGLRKLSFGLLTKRTDVLSAVQTQDVTSVEVSIKYVSGTVLVFEYKTLDGNQPKTNENAVQLWPVSANIVPFNATPEASTGILGNTPSGDQSLSAQITLAAYVLGYAVGPEHPDNSWSPYVNVVASAYIPAAATAGRTADTHSSSIKTQFVGKNTLVFHYAFLAGFDPKAANAWVGLWEGNVSPYASPPRWFAAIKQTNSSGDAALDDLQIDESTTYTLALFASGFSEKKAKLQLNRLASKVVFSGAG